MTMNMWLTILLAVYFVDPPVVLIGYNDIPFITFYARLTYFTLYYINNDKTCSIDYYINAVLDCFILYRTKIKCLSFAYIKYS